jgi:hypothetical protein
MLLGRRPVAEFGSDRFEVTGTAQLFGAEALGHPIPHFGDVTKLRSLNEDALDAQGLQCPGRFRASAGSSGGLVMRRLSAPDGLVR